MRVKLNWPPLEVFYIAVGPTSAFLSRRQIEDPVLFILLQKWVQQVWNNIFSTVLHH